MFLFLGFHDKRGLGSSQVSEVVEEKCEITISTPSCPMADAEAEKGLSKKELNKLARKAGKKGGEGIEKSTIIPYVFS